MIHESSKNGESEQFFTPSEIIYIHIQKMVTSLRIIERTGNSLLNNS